MSELHAACIVGDKEKVRAIASSDEIMIFSKPDQYGITPIHYASYEPQILRIMVKDITCYSWVQFQLRDKCGNTPLHHAVISGYKEFSGYFTQSPRM